MFGRVELRDATPSGNDGFEVLSHVGERRCADLIRFMPIVLSAALFSGVAFTDMAVADVYVGVEASASVGVHSLTAQSGAKKIAVGTVKYKTLATNNYTFIPKKTGTYRFQDDNAAASSLYGIFHRRKLPSSVMTIRAKDGDAFSRSFDLGYGDKGQFMSFCQVKLEEGVTYRIEWTGTVAMEGTTSSEFHVGLADVRVGDTLKEAGVTYRVTKADANSVYEVAVARAKKAVSIPDSGIVHRGIEYAITSIGKRAFAGNRNVQRLDFGHASIKTVEKSAFKGCVNLSAVVFNDSLRGIGAGAFEGCGKLTQIEIARFPQLKAANFRKSLQGSNVNHIGLNGLNDKEYGRLVKKCREVFAKSNSGRNVTVGWVS